MSSLRRDLIEKRLWPLVVVLVLAIAAVPFVLARGSKASTTIIPAVPTATAGSGTSGKTTGGNAVPVVAHQDLHRLTAAEVGQETKRNPFLAAPAWTGSRKTTSGGTATSTTVAATSPTTSTSASSTSTTTASSTPPASSQSSNPASVAGGTTVASAGSSAGSTGGGSPAGSSTVTQTVTQTTTAPAQTTTMTTQQEIDGPIGNGPWTMYSVDVRTATFNFTTRKLGPVTDRQDVARLTPLPSVATPKVMFTGVTDHGREAVFALGDGVQVKGKGRCLPDARICSAIALPVNGVESIIWSQADGTKEERALAVHEITSTQTHDQADATAAYKRHSQAGQCELDLADPLQYDNTSGSVSTATAADCKGVTAPVPFPGDRSGS